MKKELFVLLEGPNKYIASSSMFAKRDLYTAFKNAGILKEKFVKVGFYGLGFIGHVSYNEFARAHPRAVAGEIKRDWDKLISNLDDKYRIVSSDREVYFAPEVVSLPQAQWEKFFTDSDNYVIV